MGCKVGAARAGGRGDDDIPPGSGGEGPPHPYRSTESTPLRPPPRSEPRWGHMDIDDNMEFDPDAGPSSSWGPLDGGLPGPPGGGPPKGPPGREPPARAPYGGRQDRGPPGGPPGGDRPEEPPGANIAEDIWRWIVCLKIWSWGCEAQINKIKMGKSAAFAAKAQKELDTATFEGRKLSGMVTKLQRGLDRLEDLRSDRSDQPLPLECGFDDSWGPGPNPSRFRRRTEATRSDHAPSIRGNARRSNPMAPQRSREEKRDEWLRADYRRRRDPLRTRVGPSG